MEALRPKFWYVRGLGSKRVSESIVEALRAEGRLERWGHRAEISHREEPEELFVILRGGVHLRDGVYDGEVQLRAGDLFGDTGEPEATTRARLRAYDETTLCAITRSRFEEAASETLGSLRTRVGVVKRHDLAVPLQALLYTDPTRRLAAVLVHLVEIYGSADSRSGRLPFPIKTKHLSEVAGLSADSVQSVLDGMRRDRTVVAGRSTLVIPSLELMRQLAAQ